MVLRRCPQCGSTSDDQYGFCIKCGYEFPKIDPTKKQCPLCGVENPDEAEFCVKCGTPLVLNNFNAQGKINPIIINKNAGAPVSAPAQGKWTRLIIIFGYVFSILGGLIGLILALYLVTRKDPSLRKHGIIQLAIFGFYVVVIAALYASGMIPPELITNYTQLLAGNFTR
ncbi:MULTISPECIES: zinc ribbon domain-containing protein [Methanobrevibacter]|uniref:zinc ribbon domain-containing protein n=1 Tax=Methanobrevibacter TaxID=2172 RepID=UPI0015BB0AC3|nr:MULTISPECIES: zinc ribbon domain-containing protein [Methanobrevibacter]MBS7257374.1 zinc ribbon domain-containing protein [Methanobrevibacter sp.]MCI7428368.1 zinc ribbon domain-containing protein [Methanobrevibacter sp.]MDD6776156.1 zinc ribbon domain-containing protein [Methanobacteriaceae archaeon]MDY3096113.1 zinc ribbon domain-containing protein [Methanobrevibacter sp.]